MPTIAMMVFTSIYGVVDGLFVSNSVGKNAFAAINLVVPVLMISFLRSMFLSYVLLIIGPRSTPWTQKVEFSLSD